MKLFARVKRTNISDYAVYYMAIDLYSTKRDEYQIHHIAIEDNFKVRGLQLAQLLVRNITLPNRVKSAIEKKINAEQEAQKRCLYYKKNSRKPNAKG